jgi:hypothetical protein
MARRRASRLVLGGAVLLLAASEFRPAGAGDPSPAYRESLRRTIELRNQRRRSAQPAVGVIEAYPMPPVLIIRHRPEVHEEIGALLDVLRYGGR